MTENKQMHARKQTNKKIYIPMLILYGGLLILLHWSDEAATMMV